MASSGNENMNGNGNINGNGFPNPLENQPNLSGVARVAAFRQCNPPVYDGRNIGIEAQSWLHGIHALFQASELPESTWVSLVVVQLTGKVALWWDAAGNNPSSMNWSNFTSAFLSRFALLDQPPPALVFEQETAT